MQLPEILSKASWYRDLAPSGDVRPYVFVRPDNKIQNPGSRHHLDWFPMAPLYKNPLELAELEFAEQIYFIEENAFGAANMTMPRWVFFDCAVMPGFVAGFAMRTSKLPAAIKKVMRHDPKHEWTPLSLFIIIPTMAKGQWVAHNLCAINSLLGEEDRLYGLGFLSKAFGLWYANVESCCGMTQWANPALKLHTHYGVLEIVTAYTPVHSHAKTITYRAQVNTSAWEQFFTREPDLQFLEKYESAGFNIEPKDESSMIALHNKIMSGEGPYFLSSTEIASKKLGEPLTIFREKRLI
jgi:hypothetical protein